MRRILLAAALLCASIPGAVAAKPKFPYVAYAAADGVSLRSGPGDEHYATDQLERGTKVEVHRHDPGGWYAVRPLPGSFSWIPAKQVEMTDEPDVAVVTAPNTVSWVGSRAGLAASLKWQIELKQGELVEVIGGKKLALAEGEPEETCYKIAPPAGEFRWVQGKFVTRRGADELAEEPLETKVVDTNVKPAGLEVPVEQPVAPEASGDKDAEPKTAVPTPATAPKSDGFVPRKPRTSDGKDAVSTPTATTAPPLKPVGESAPISGGESSLEARLRELDVELSLLVAQPPATWNLAPLRQTAAQLMDAGETAPERGRARLLVEKIDAFSAFASRQPARAANSLATSAATIAKPKGLIDASAGPVGSGVRGSEFAPDIDPRYDGIGWLMPVHSQARSTPSYALLDNEGKVLQYVTPATGLNLSRHVRTQVGIYGQRGYVPQLRAPHLTAQRIVSLERHRK